MAETSRDISGTLAHFDNVFETLAIALKTSAREANHVTASSEAERFGLVSAAPSRPPGEAWQTTENGFTLRFQWRYYDQSGPFSLQKDMNILSLDLCEGDRVLRQVEERFED